MIPVAVNPHSDGTNEAVVQNTNRHRDLYRAGIILENLLTMSKRHKK